MTAMSLLTITLMGLFGVITSNPMYDMGHPVGMGFGRAMASRRFPMLRPPMMMMPMASSYPMAPPMMMSPAHSYPSMPPYRPPRHYAHPPSHSSPYRQHNHQLYPTSYPLEDDSDIFRDPNIVRMLNKLEADNSAEYHEEPTVSIGGEEDAHDKYHDHPMPTKYHEPEEVEHFKPKSYSKKMKQMMKESGEEKYPVESHEEGGEVVEEGPEMMHAYKPKKLSSPYYPPTQEEYYQSSKIFKAAPDSIGAWQQQAAGHRGPVEEEEVETGGLSSQHHHQEEVNTEDDRHYHRPSSVEDYSSESFRPDEESEGSSWRPVGKSTKKSLSSTRPQLSGYQEIGAYTHAITPMIRHHQETRDESSEQAKQRPRMLTTNDYTGSSRYDGRPEEDTHYILARNTYHQHSH